MKKIRILKLPLWLFISLSIILVTLIVFGIILINAIIQFKKPVKTQPVETDIKVESVEITNCSDQIVLDIEEKYQLEYKVYPENAINKIVSFKSSDENIAKVTEEGLVTAVNSGNTTVQVITQDGNYIDSIIVIVRMVIPTETKIDVLTEINNSLETITFSEEINNNIICLDINNNLLISFSKIVSDANYLWESSNANILKITSQNIGDVVFTPLSSGNVTITLNITHEDCDPIIITYNVNVTEEIIINNPVIDSIDVYGLSEYYEGDVIDKSLIKLSIHYDNEELVVLSLNEYNSELILDTVLSDCEELIDGKCKKEIKFTYIDEYENSFEVNLEYYVIKLVPVSLTVKGIEDEYLINSTINVSKIIVTYNNGEIRYLELCDTTNNLVTLDMTTSGEKVIEFSFDGCEFTKTILVIESRNIIVGLKNQYSYNEVIDFSNVYFEKAVNDNITKYYFKDVFSNEELLGLIDTSVAGDINFSYTYLDNLYTFGKITIQEEVIENKEIDAYTISGLNKSYYINDNIDLSGLSFKFIYDKEDYEVLTYNEISKYIISGDFSTSTVGNKKVIINYNNQEFVYEYSVKYYEFNNYSLIDVNKYYYLGASAKVNGKVTIYCNDFSYNETISLTDKQVKISGLSTSELGAFTMTISIELSYLSSPIIINHIYNVVNPLKVSETQYNSLTNDFVFYVNTDKQYYNDNMELIITGNQSYIVNSIEKNESGNFKVSVSLINGKSSANISCILSGTSCKVVVSIKKLSVSLLTFNINVPSNYILINNKVSFEITAYYNDVPLTSEEYKSLTFNWTDVDGLTIDNTNPRKVSFISSVEGIFKFTCSITDGSKYKSVSASVNYCEKPYTNLGFTLGNKTFGIGKNYVLASKYIANTLTQSNAKVMTYNFDVFGSSSNLDRSKLVFYVKEEDKNIANFVNNELYVYESGEVTLYVTTKEAQYLGYTGDEYIGIYIGTWKVQCIGNALYVTNYLQLKFAFDNGYKVVLDKDIVVGPEVMDIVTDKSTGITTRTLKSDYTSIEAISMLNTYLYKIESTWNTKYIENFALLNNREPKTTLNVIVNVTNDLYGNGYTIDCSQYTTLSEALNGSTTPPFFNGPLKFVEALSICRVYGQDDIGFLVHDNVTIDNVTLQNCDSGYLKSNGKNDYAKLNKVGTVVEVMGDNVNITNSRLLNGRNIIRAYGSSDKDQLIHVSIDKCIISNAREYLIKIGANKSLHTDSVMNFNGVETKVTDLYTKYGMKMDKVSREVLKGEASNDALLFNSSSPYLTDADGINYDPLDFKNLQDEYFVNNYLKTDFTLKDSVLEGCGFFAICLESMFAGPVLGGFQYAPKDIDLGIGGFDYNGIYDINATSYAAVLRLKGDVRIYNWKRVDEFDSSTIMEQISNAQALLKLVGEDTKFEFNIKEILNNVAPTDPTIIATKNKLTYAHGGIIFYGGGKNYHQLDLSEYTGYTLSTHDVSMNQMGSSTFVKCIPWVAGRSPFRFVMYDSESELSYDLQEYLYSTNQAYSNVND